MLPAYVAAGTAVLALLTDLLFPGRWSVPAIVVGIGAVGTGAAAVVAGLGDGVRGSFCAQGACSYEADSLAVLVGVVFAILTVGTLALSGPILRAKVVPAGEYAFLLACSMTGGVLLGGARDLILLIVAVETVTIPLYVLVGLRRQARAAEASLTFFITSVVATSVALLGAGLIYAASGTVMVGRLDDLLAVASRMEGVETLIPVGIVLLLVGLAVKVAAVPVHGWAAPTYDGAPLPVAAFLSTASKFAGITSLLIVLSGLRGQYDVAGPTLAVVAVLTMTVGNLVALRQRRMVRLLAWSSIAQGGYLLAPLGALAGWRVGHMIDATLAYTVFFIVLEFGVFATLVAVRGAADGGEIAAYRGVARRSWWVGAALVLALTGLAGLPPGIAGLFAKVAVIESVIDAGGNWLAVVVALNAVVALAYYARLIGVLFAGPEPAGVAAGAISGASEPAAAGPEPAGAPEPATATPAKTAVATLAPVVRAGDPRTVPPTCPAIAVVVAIVVVTVTGVAIGLAPQLVLDVAKSAADGLVVNLG
ncbi:MAG: NADH-quinone oxidoreductase subunit N [Dactylosporangium sp.]|nr:NADH-quinone oxidoreductase subunit N [Dactylosporangium sp.]NNJ61453.1 NADH-quinone oxidoreductase subunit N [Dactylosporangium sp.]